SVPSLTTVAIPRVEMGYRAVEMLLAALHGSPMSAPVVLSPRLVVRRSCGCLTSAVVQADVPLCLSSGQGSLNAVLSERRADILLAMRQSMGQMESDRPVDAARGPASNAALRVGIEPGWAEQLLDGLASDISQPKAVSAFLTALETGLEQTVLGQGDVKVWQDVLSALRRQLVPCLDGLVVADGASALPRIESLFQQARVVVAEAIDQAAARRRLRTEQQSQALRTIGQRLVTLFDLDELRDTLVRELPALGIKSAYLALYQDSVTLDPMPLGITSVGKWAQLMLAYDGSDRGERPPDERRFPVHRLLPDDILPNRAHHFVVEPLFVGEEQLGFLLLDSDQEGYVYEALRGQISSALYGVLLLRQQKLVQIEADQSRQQLERALRDLQATQRRYVEQTWEGYVSSADTVQGYVHADDEQGPTTEAWLPEMTDVVQHGEPVVKKDGSALAVPITLSGEIVGVLGGSGSHRERWSEQEIDAVQAIVDQMALALNSQRLFDQARGRSEELTVLYEMGRSLSAQLDVDQVLDQVYESVSHLIEAANFYVGLYDPDTNQVTFPLDVSNSQVDKAITVISADEGMTGYVIRSAQSLLIDHDVPGWMRAHDVPVVGELAQCWMGAPLLLGDQVQGVIAVQSYDTPFAYDEDDLNTLTAIASQATTALQNARLFEQARLRSEELLVLNELGQALTARLEVDDVLQEAYQQVSRLMVTENFYIGLYDQQTRTIDFVFTVTDSEIDRSIVSVSVDQGLAGYIVRNRTSVLLPDNVRERQEALGITIVGQESASWLGVPMLIGDRVLGVIAVQSYTASRLYGEHERELLVAVAGPTAIAIQNALLLDEARERARREQILREISTRLRGSTDPDVIVRAAVRELGLALNRRTFVRLGSVDELSVALSVRQAADSAANHAIEGGE
ncbi:MAG: GAF domain-containing protein, partial [Anaerolineae bacterium]|nr:GAF domain-containing protein [Anaerolineae bacterium]